MDSYRFGTVDYIVLVGMTILSTGTGLYFGGIKKTSKHIDDVELTNIAKGKSLKQNFGSDKIDEYLMGSRNMNVVPVSISLIGSFVSGVTIMGIPSEIYHYGTQYFLVIMPIILQGIAISYIYLPVYSALKVHSAYQYLEMRFNSSVRTIASFMFIFSTHDDQLLPLFVVETVGHIYGMPGLFIAGIFGAGLSTLSSCFNTVALVFLEDIVRGCLKLQPSERVSTILIKSSIVFQGVMAFLLVFLIRELRGVLSVCNSIASITAGTALGIFTLGMLVPWSNTVGTATGGIISIILAAWLSFGSQIAAALGQLSSQMLPVSVEGCLGNVTTPQKHWVDQEEVFPLYRLSYHWINPIGVVTTVVVGALVSLVTKPTDIKTINSKLISPVIHRFLPRECFRDLHFNEESLKKVFK
uniref:Sodium-coupled monocarboxylate transporter 1 n=1 Tax=Drosophila rhopaloa TaxID=1041015 RepID=A0A6P4FCI3_DRORH